jgi:hypothetical protein
MVSQDYRRKSFWNNEIKSPRNIQNGKVYAPNQRTGVPALKSPRPEWRMNGAAALPYLKVEGDEWQRPPDSHNP